MPIPARPVKLVIALWMALAGAALWVATRQYTGAVQVHLGQQTEMRVFPSVSSVAFYVFLSLMCFWPALAGAYTRTSIEQPASARRRPLLPVVLVSVALAIGVLGYGRAALDRSVVLSESGIRVTSHGKAQAFEWSQLEGALLRSQGLSQAFYLYSRDTAAVIDLSAYAQDDRRLIVQQVPKAAQLSFRGGRSDLRWQRSH